MPKFDVEQWLVLIDVLGSVPEHLPNTDRHRWIIEELSDRFAADNPKFDPVTWEQAIDHVAHRRRNDRHSRASRKANPGRLCVSDTGKRTL